MLSRRDGPGTVTVRFMMDDVRAPTGIPTQADVDIVAAYIDPRRPVTADVTVVAPVAHPVAVAISQLQPDTPEIRDAIFASLTQMLLDEASPGTPIYLSQWSTAIGITAGVERFVMDRARRADQPGARRDRHARRGDILMRLSSPAILPSRPM